jgi:transcriptional regulator with XRE-family HTH domain
MDEFQSEPASRIVADRIREVRQRRGLSQRALAEIIDSELGYSLDAPTISKIEKRTRSVTLDDLLVIAAALNIAPFALLRPSRAPELVSIGRNEMTPNTLDQYLRGLRPLLLHGDDVGAEAMREKASGFDAESLSEEEVAGLRLFPAYATLRKIYSATEQLFPLLAFSILTTSEVSKENESTMRQAMVSVLHEMAEKIPNAIAEIEKLRKE